MADEYTGINIERFYTDSENSKLRLKDINSIAFSMSFDFDFMGVFEIFDKFNIPFCAKDRGEEIPLIFAGGPVLSTNPEPYKEFFDFMIIGDGESVFKQVLEVLALKLSKFEILNRLSKISGIYIPGVTEKVQKITENLNDVIYTCPFNGYLRFNGKKGASDDLSETLVISKNKVVEEYYPYKKY